MYSVGGYIVEYGLLLKWIILLLVLYNFVLYYYIIIFINIFNNFVIRVL